VPYIYALVDPGTGQVRYIGKANDVAKRLKAHLRAARKGSKTYCARWLSGLLQEGRDPVVEILEEVAAEGWIEAERRWIAHYTDAAAPLTNLTAGGDGAIPNEINGDEYRRRVSAGVRRWAATDPDYKEKCGRATRGKKLPPEWRAKIGAAQVGKKIAPEAIAKAKQTKGQKAYPKRAMPAEHKEKLRRILTGRVVSAETRAKLSAARKGRSAGPWTAERKAKASTKLKGRVFSEEARAKMSAAKQGWTPSPELVAVVKQAVKGEGNGRAKLTVEQVAEIKRRREEEGLTLVQLGEIYGVCFSQISRILKDQAWAKR
jgi:hypothetical protein